MTEFRTPTAAELLAEAHWLRRLLRDQLPAHAVDDALQETWTRALRGVPRAPAALRPWLRTVSRRVASAFRRGESRRRAREARAARSEVLPSTGDVLERLDLQQRVTRIVRDLPEPYRVTLLLRYYEDLPVAEIARRCETTPDNVYARLARARLLIRERLPENMRARVPLVLAPGVAGAGVVVGVTVLLLVGVGAFWWGGQEDPQRFGVEGDAGIAQSRAAGQRAQLRPPSEGRREAAVASPPVIAREKTGPRPAARGRGFVVVVRPVPARASVSLTQAGETWVERVDARGRATFRDAGVGEVQLQLHIEPHALRFEKPWRIRRLGEEHRWQLGMAVLAVEIYQHDGSPADGAFVWLSGEELDVYAETDVRGAAELSFLPAGEYRLYAAIEADGEKVMEEVRQLALGSRTRAREVFGSPTGLPRWRGVLRARTGDPVAGSTAGARAKIVLTHAETGALVPVFPDASGAFEVRLPGGTYRVLGSPPSFPEAHHRLADVTISAREVELDLELPGARVVGRAHGLGEALAGTELVLQRFDDSERQHVTSVRDDGGFVFDGVEPGRWVLRGETMRDGMDVRVDEVTRIVQVDVVLR